MAAHSETLATSLARRLRKKADELEPPETDADRVRAFPQDPYGFAREILGIDLWSRQREIVESTTQHKRVATVSGHKVGKSTALAVLALWFYCSFPGARVVIMAATDRQVNGIIWREIKRLVRNARVKIPGADQIHVRASSGLSDPSDFSEVRGYTAKEAEAVAGTSGAYILYLIDEASGVGAPIFQAIEGNRAAGNAWIFLISNPTRADGEFYEAFHARSKRRIGEAGYHTIHIDSRESPNITGEWRELEEWDRKAGAWCKRATPIPGLAVQQWVDEKLQEWGEDHSLFKIRIAGLFAVAEDAKIFPAMLLAEAQERWDEPPGELEGRLYIGADPAGDGDGGDASTFCVRRGLRVLEFRKRHGLSPERHIAEIEDLRTTHATKGESPVVCVDSEGETGWKVYVRLKEFSDRRRTFDLARIRSSEKAIREPLIYDRIRDELYANARAWMREGGAIPENAELEADLHAPEFVSNIRGRLKATPKKDLRELLGRSPDLGDSFLLACWEPLAARYERDAPAGGAAGGLPEAPDLDTIDETFDPYNSAFV